MSLKEELAAIVGPGHVLTDPHLVAGHVRDWAGRWTGGCALVVRPGDQAQTAAVLAAVASDGAPGRGPGRQHRPGRRGPARAR